METVFTISMISILKGIGLYYCFPINVIVHVTCCQEMWCSEGKCRGKLQGYHWTKKNKTLFCWNVIPQRTNFLLYINLTIMGFKISLQINMKEKTALRSLALILFIGLMPCEITGKPISHTKSYFGVSMVQLQLKNLSIISLLLTRMQIWYQWHH